MKDKTDTAHQLAAMKTPTEMLLLAESPTVEASAPSSLRAVPSSPPGDQQEEPPDEELADVSDEDMEAEETLIIE